MLSGAIPFRVFAHTQVQYAKQRSIYDVAFMYSNLTEGCNNRSNVIYRTPTVVY